MDAILNDAVRHWEQVSVGLMLCLLLCMLAYHIRTTNPRYQEKVMARKLERQRIADIVGEALDQALLNNNISSEVRNKYYKKLGRALNIPELIVPDKKPTQETLKLLSVSRLTAMGVNIVEGLKKLRRNKPHSRKDQLRIIKK